MSTSSTCPVVGIGASAGGLDALRRLIGSLPADTPFAVVVIQHLDPSTPSQLAEILARVSALPVLRSRGGEELRAGTVYVIPEGREAVVFEHRLRLRRKASGCHNPIDTLFQSLAEHSQDAGCAVLLSGNGSDGVTGLREVRGAGGLTFVQDPSDAEFPSMPSAAIDSGVCDFVGTPEEIAVQLVARVNHPSFGGHGRSAASKVATKREAEAMGRILALVRVESGMDFTGYKSSTVMRRVGRRAMLADVPSVVEYFDVVNESPEELAALVDDLLINVTQFFRDADVFAALRERVFPELIRSKSPEDDIRIWVIGCSTGEEVYSVLISALEAFEEAKQSPRITIFGTDASEPAIRRARTGVYPASSCSNISSERLAKFFVRTERGYEIDRSLREMCVFARQDVTRDTPFSRLDLVSIRNVLIYMEQPLQQQVLAIAHFALKPEGYLLLGTSETPESGRGLFRSFDKANHLFSRQNVASKLPLDIAASTRANIEALSMVPPMLDAEGRAADPHSAANELTLLLYGPPRVIADANGRILHFFGDTSPYLEHPAGRASLELSEMAHPGIALELADAFKTARDAGIAVTREASFVAGGAKRQVSIEITPLPATPGESTMLVAFREGALAGHEELLARGADDLSRLYEEREQRVRRELGALRGRVRSIADEKEQVNQSLRSANEEVRSSNEELQSINEELETAKEELQSANEELITVNDELRQSNFELVAANDDLANFASSIDVPVLMLDRGLRVRRFTPQAERIVHVEPSDVGRLIGHLRMRVDAPNLSRAASQVMESGEACQLEVRDEQGRWFTMRLQPYLSSEGTVDGVVISFLDIDLVKREAERSEVRARLSEALAAIDADLASTMDFDTVMQRAIDRGVSALDCDSGTIELRDAGDWVISYQNGFSADDVGRRMSAQEAPNAETAARTASTLMVGDLAPDHERYVGFVADYGLRSVLAVPLIVRDEVVGSLLFYRRQRPRDFTPDEIDFGQRLGASASLALENVRLLEAEREAARRARSLNAINEIVQAASTRDELLGRLVAEVSEVAGADRSLMMVLDDDHYTITHVRNVRSDLVGQPMDAPYFPAFASSAAEKRPLLVGDTWSDSRTNKDFVVPFELRSFQLLPLIVDGEVRAIFALACDKPQVYEPADLDFAERLVTAMSVALTKVTLLEAEIAARNEARRELETTTLLLDVAGVLAGQGTIDEKLKAVALKIAEGLDHKRVVVDIWDEASNLIRVVTTVGGESPAKAVFPWDELSVASRKALTTRASVLIDYSKERAAVRRVSDEAAFCLALAVPMVSGGRSVGLFVADQPGEARPFSARERQLIESIASEAATAVENARLFEVERRRVENMQLLTEVGEIAVSTLEAATMAQQFAELFSRHLEAKYTIVFDADKARGRLVPTAAVGFPKDFLERFADTWAIDGDSEAARAYRSGATRVESDLAALEGLSERTVQARSNLPAVRASLAVPLKARGAVIGTLSFVWDEPREFDADQIDFVEAAAAEMATALCNARLFESERAQLATTRILLDVAGSTATLHLDEVLGRIVTLTSEHLRRGRVMLYLFDPDNDEEMRTMAAHGGGVQVLGATLKVSDYSPEIQAATMAIQPTVIDFRAKGISAKAKAERKRLNVESILYVPLMYQGRHIGNLTIDDPLEYREFSADEVELAMALASQAAVAIDNARLFELESEARQVATTRAEHAACLREIAETGTTEHTVADVATRQIGVLAERLGVVTAYVFVVDERRTHLVPVALLGIGDATLASQFGPIGIDTQGASPTVFRTGQPSLIEDVETDPLVGEAARAFTLRMGNRSGASMPMRAGGTTIGVVSFGWSETRKFDPETVVFLESVASEMALGLQNAQLFEDRAEQARRQSILKRVAETGSSSLEPREVGRRLVELVGEVFGAARVMINQVRDDALVPLAGFGFPDGFLEAIQRFPDDSVSAAVLRADGPVYQSDLDDVELSDFADKFRTALGGRAHFGIRLAAGRQPQGTLSLMWSEPRAFEAEDVAFLESVAAQISVALQNAELYDAERLTRSRVQTLHELTELVASAVDLKEVADRGLAYIHDHAGVHAMTFWLLDGDTGRLKPFSGIGFPDGFYADFPGGVGLGDNFDVATAVRENVTIVHATTALDETPSPVRERYQRFGVPLEALLVAPVRGRGGVLGAITFAWDRPRGFDESAVRFFSAIADEFAIATENATLFAEKELELERTRLLQAAATASASSLSASELAERMLDACREVIGAKAANAYLYDADAHVLNALALFGFPESQRRQMEQMPLNDGRASARAFVHDEIVTHDSPDLPGKVSVRAKAVKATDDRWIALPIRARGHVIGSLGFIFDELRPFRAEEIALYESLADELGVGLENARLFEAECAARELADRELEIATQLLAAADALVSWTDLQTIGQQLAEILVAATGRGRAIVDTYDSERRELCVIGSAGEQRFETDSIWQLDAVTPATRAAIEERRTMIADFDALQGPDRGVATDPYRLRNVLLVPLVQRDRVLGLIVLDDPGERAEFTERQIEFVEAIAAEATVAIDNARLFEAERATSQRVSATLASISDGFYVLDREWHFTYANAEAARMMGVATPDELIGRTIGQATGMEALDRAQREIFGPAMDEGRLVEVERYFPQTQMWADIRAYPFEQGIAAYGRDITAAKAAEEALRAVRERADMLARLLDESSQAFGIGRLDGRMGLVNQAFEELTGYSAHELEELSWLEDLTPPGYEEVEARALALLRETGQAVRYEKEYIRKDGSLVPVELLVHLASDEAGRPAYYFAFVTDLTDRKERERLDAVFNEIRTEIGESLDSSWIVRTALRAGCEALGADCVTLTRHGRSGWEVAESINMPKPLSKGHISEAEALLAPLVEEHGRPVLASAESGAYLSMGAGRRFRVRSGVAAPLGAEGVQLGVIAFYKRGEKCAEFDSIDLDFVSKLARAVTIAIQNALLYERERRIADTLQDALLLPPEPIDGIQASYLYRAASDTANVGGDFYDVFSLGGGRCAVLVGDVSGKGIDAARLTSLMHDGIRAYALETTEPADILSRLNALVVTLTPPEQYATVFLGVLDIDSGKLRYCTAGHPPPAVVGCTDVAYLLSSKSPVLGAFEHAEFHSQDTVIVPGERLVLFTDGVTEARRGSQFLGEDGLAKLLGKMTRTPNKKLPARLLERVLEFADGHLRDDTVILSLERTSQGDGVTGK